MQAAKDFILVHVRLLQNLDERTVLLVMLARDLESGLAMPHDHWHAPIRYGTLHATCHEVRGRAQGSPATWNAARPCHTLVAETCGSPAPSHGTCVHTYAVPPEVAASSAACVQQADHAHACIN